MEKWMAKWLPVLALIMAVPMVLKVFFEGTAEPISDKPEYSQQIWFAIDPDNKTCSSTTVTPNLVMQNVRLSGATIQSITELGGGDIEINARTKIGIKNTLPMFRSIESCKLYQTQKQ